MITFVPTVFEDDSKIQSWIDADPWHSIKDTTSWWMSGGYLRFKLVDEEGIVVFVRFDREGESWIRMNGQFAPKSEVDEKRVAAALLQSIPKFISHAKTNGVTGIITESISPRLIAFLCKYLKFKPYEGNDFLLMFSEEL